jgi:hypothetical protein
MNLLESAAEVDAASEKTLRVEGLPSRALDTQWGSEREIELDETRELDAELDQEIEASSSSIERESALLRLSVKISEFAREFQMRMRTVIVDERGDVPGWVLVVLMTTGLVTGIWTVAAPRINSLLRGSLDAMNNVR